MPVDDTDDKVRRNLVVFSALIVASAWLGHPELWLVTKLLTPEAATPPAWKVSTLALAVLIYLFARYWFSAAHMNARTHMKEEWYLNKYTILLHLITQSISKYNKTQKQPIIIKTDLSDYSKEEAKERGLSSNEKFEIRFTSVQISQTAAWVGEISTQLEFISSTYSGVSYGGRALIYEIPSMRRGLIKFQATLTQSVYSKTAVEYFTPLALSATALGILLVRIAADLSDRLLH